MLVRGLLHPGTALWADAEGREVARQNTPVDVTQLPDGGAALMAGWAAKG